MKKSISIVLTLVMLIMLVTITGCSTASTTTSATTAGTTKATTTAPSTSEDKIVIGYTAFSIGVNGYTTTHDKAFREAVEKMGVEAIILDPKGDAAIQQNQVEDLIQKKVDVIVVWPCNGQAILPACKKAKDAGIPVVIANSPIDPSGKDSVNAYAGPDNYAQGKAAGEEMIEGLNGKGKVVELTGLPGYVTTIERSQGFQDVLKSAAGIELLESQPADWNREKAQKMMESLLLKYPEINGVYCADDDIAQGAINALKNANRLDGVIITAATLFGEGYDAIKAGIQYGSVFQSPAEDAKITVETAIRLAKGETVPYSNVFATPKVTKANVDSFERPSF